MKIRWIATRTLFLLWPVLYVARGFQELPGTETQYVMFHPSASQPWIVVRS